MNPSPITKKSIILSLLFSISVLIVFAVPNIFHTQTLVVFCNVGQGDGAYIRINNKIDLLVDTGLPNNTMLTCLGRYMPFYDRTLEYVIISHPQSDHAGGLFEIIKRYKINTLMSIPIDENRTYSRELKKILNTHELQPTFVYKDMVLNLPQAHLVFHSPSLNQLERFASDVNDLSLVFEFITENGSVFFTGDAPTHILSSLKIEDTSQKIILKVPHHGSKYGLSQKNISLINPIEAVISVGKNNSYGHPAQEVLRLLETNSIKIRRTDEEGDIVYKLPN